MEESTIRLPEEVKKELGLQGQEKLTLQLDGSRIIIECGDTIAKSQGISLKWSVLPSVIAALAFFAYFKYYVEMRYIPFTGRGDTISNVTIVLGLLTGMISFAIFFIRGKKKRQENLRNIYWRNLPVLLISFAVMLTMVLFGMFWILGIVFEGASFDVYTSTFFSLLFSGIINYLMIYFAVTITPTRIISLFTTVIVGGIFMSMIANANLQWWQINFSFLGTSKAASSWQFNLTLILSALLFMTLTDYTFNILREALPQTWRLLVLRVLMTAAALALAGVGVFPNNKGTYLHVLHNRAADALVYLIIVMIIGIRWLLPQIKKEFLIASYTIGFFLVLANVLFSNVRYLSLTAFEIIAFCLAFAWILLLFQNLQGLSTRDNRGFEVVVE